MTEALHRGPHRTLPILVAVGLLLAWLPVGSAWGDARSISDDLCDAPFDAEFDDVEGSAHEDNVLCMAEHGLTEGVGDGSSYAPRRDVTRGQMASFVARFLEAYTGEPLPAGDTRRFDDVPEDDRHYPHATNIHSLAAIDVVEGTSASDGRSYAPQVGVTRAQMASMIRRALSWADDGDARNDSAPPAGDQRAFGDTAGSVHEDNIDAIAAVGVVEGFEDDTYRPSSLVKRDQMASFVMRSYDYALEADLGRDDEDENEDPPSVSITHPTSSDTAQAHPGEAVDVTFTSHDADQYEIDFRSSADGEWTSFGGDAAGDITEEETEATVTVPFGTDDGTYDVRATVTGSGGSATATSVGALEVLPPGPVAILSPTTSRPDFPVTPGQAVDITFRTDRAGEYDLEFRNPDPEPDTILGFPLPGGDDDGPGAWTDFDGEDASDSVSAGGVHERTVILPDDEDDEGVRDIRLTFRPDDPDLTTITTRQDAALIVGDGIVVNLTEGRIDFAIEDSVDQAEDGHVLLAFGDFAETATIDKNDLVLSGAGTEDTGLTGTLIIEGAYGVTVSDMTIADYDTIDGILGVGGDEVGVAVRDAGDVTLTALTLQGSTPASEDVGIAVASDVDGIDIALSSFLDNDTGIVMSSQGAISGENYFENNGRGVQLDGAAAQSVVDANEFIANYTAILVLGVNEAIITDNEFDEQINFTVNLEEDARFAEVNGNGFDDGNNEHIRFHSNDYSSSNEQSFLDDNDYESEPEVVTHGPRRIIRPVDE